MAFTKCPLCAKRYPETFITAHASSCNPSVKRPRTDRHIGTHVYRTAPPRSSPPSETVAPGFHIFPDVFSDVEEDLLHYINTTPPQWNDYRFRKVKNYGPPYNFREKRFLFGPSAPPQIPIPQFVRDIVLPRMRRLPVISEFTPDQLSVSKYPVPGGHIKPHNDCETGIIRTAVVGVCLAAPCTMTLILRARYTGLGRDVKKDVVLPSGAVYIMSRDALRVWEHAIFPQNIPATRYSLTFRDVSPATRAPSSTEVKAGAKHAREIELSSKTYIKPHDADDQPTTVNTAKEAASQLSVKRRRMVQQRLT